MLARMAHRDLMMPTLEEAAMMTKAELVERIHEVQKI